MADSGNNENQGEMPEAVCTCGKYNVDYVNYLIGLRERYNKQQEDVAKFSAILSDCLINNLNNIGNDLSSFKIGEYTVDQMVCNDPKFSIGGCEVIDGCNGAIESINGYVGELSIYSELLSSEIGRLDIEIENGKEAISNCSVHSGMI